MIEVPECGTYPCYSAADRTRTRSKPRFRPYGGYIHASVLAKAVWDLYIESAFLG